MFKYLGLGLPLILTATLTCFGCSSSEDDEGGGGSGNGGSAAGGGFNPGSGGSAAGTFDGGHRPLTPDEEQAINSSACDGWSFEPELLPAALELVVDVSSSMNQRAPGSNQTKWEATRDALLDAITGDEDGGGLPASLSVGLVFYPNRQVNVSENEQDVSACVNTDASVPIAVLGGPTAGHRTRIREAIQDVELNQSTPTHDAYRYAFETEIGPSTAATDKYMLLITDGEPTLLLGCQNPSGQLNAVDPEPIVDEVQRAANDGISTFLIGSPGSENNREWMSRAAVIGGTAPDGCDEDGPNWCHMDMTTAPDFSAALRAGLATVTGAIAPCVATIPDAPAGQVIDYSKINVFVERPGEPSTLIIRDEVGDCSEGWQIVDNRVELCSASCDLVQNNPDVTVNVRFGCASLPSDPE